ncbi:uncharacterized protein EDB91DRAFT_1249378 [Suillus paluster]|uniref:uncharacterized protein n=1 Tax=Suillus paluster TaxID=48578 RepID=UPI001B874EE2|nr:uncharacterized protein EDB91DRAFT_1249378 [Suillus paluster]KAG1738082.1 hypothetical protein EDB91DRAFT_1249378 [Suillus paluster]
MAGNNSEADEEAPKQVPLNEGEVAVLESYLEQWDSTSGQERNVVWGDATTETRLKAPGMDAKLLKSQKTVYRKWLQNHRGKKKDAKPPINLGRKWTYRAVVGSLRKKELLKKIEDETGVKPGEPEMMNHYAKYLAEMVNSLTEKEVEEATEMAEEWKSKEFRPSEMFKKAGMWLFMLSAWKNEDGKLLVSSHDYNDEFGNGESFSKTGDWQVILPEWESYVSKQFDKEVEDDAVVRKGRKDNTYVLEIGCDGLPILPDHGKMDSDTRKAVVRAFLNWHYQDCSSRPKDPVPWKEVIPRPEELIPPMYLPEGRKLREPSRMNWEEATELLDFWYNRQENIWDVTFEFYGWWSKADKEVKPPVAEAEADTPVDGQAKENPGGKAKTRVSVRRKSVFWAIVPSDSSDDDEDGRPTKTAKPARRQAAKTTHQPKTWVDPADPGDEFHQPDSPDESSDEERPATRKGKEPVKQKAKRPRKEVAETRGEDEAPLEVESRPVMKTRACKQGTAPANRLVAPTAPQKPSPTTDEPSASRGVPTPLDRPRRVGPASQPGGALWRKPSRGQKDGPAVVLQHSTKKHKPGRPRRKKCAAEDELKGSPAKRTRSKTTDVLPKRSKKPNSRYAANFMRS